MGLLREKDLYDFLILHRGGRADVLFDFEHAEVFVWEVLDFYAIGPGQVGHFIDEVFSQYRIGPQRSAADAKGQLDAGGARGSRSQIGGDQAYHIDLIPFEMDGRRQAFPVDAVAVPVIAGGFLKIFGGGGVVESPAPDVFGG